MRNGSPPAIEWRGRPAGVFGLLLLRLLRRAAALRPEAARRLVRRRLQLRAGPQAVTLAGHDGRLVLTGDDGAGAEARAEGDLATLLAAARGHAARELLCGRLRVRGRAWRLWPLLTLFRALGVPPGPEPDLRDRAARRRLAATAEAPAGGNA